MYFLEIIFNFQFSIFNYFCYLCTVIWIRMGFWQKNRVRNGGIRNLEFLVGSLALLACVACGNVATPRPYGYYRISVPDTAYMPFSPSLGEGTGEAFPYTFALSRNAVVKPRLDVDEPYWVNLCYPSLNATVHCSYKPVHNNLRELTNDALEFVYRNASFANAIPEQDYAHPEARVYGVLFDLEGNTASSCQFFVTDSVRHFFRASVYCNCPPNADSLAPVYDYLRTDVIKMVETFQWTK